MKKLNKIIRAFYKKHRKKIMDIILYGSAIKGKPKPRDIDIIIIFKAASKKEYFDIPYELRKLLEKEGLKADVKGIFLEEIFNPSLLSRTALLLEGYSFIKKSFLAKQLGFTAYSVFKYSLKNLSHSKKTRFQYALGGRGTKQGILDELNGQHIGAGAVFIPIQLSEQFKNFLISWDIKFDELQGLFIKR